ncbi:MAG: hypothetical protein A2Y72_00785 [Chloroflexi bacterium RBG_13_53_26]|nr:MAG: hypothetical protein A2Y72_00785 [Chloroflexi bacterium RBG_13_53_26]
MSIIHLPNGIGDTLGDVLATTKPLEVNGNVWYCHYGTGTDAVSPAGQNRQAPLKTLGQANTNAANGDIIVLMDGHTETLTSALLFTKDLTIVGAGSSGGRPTVRFINNSAAASLFTVSASGLVQFRNIWFAAQTQACSAAKIIVNTANGSVVINGCYFEGGAYDADWQLEIVNSEVVLIKNTTFISTATSVATQPKGAIGTEIGTAIAVCLMDGVTVSGGTYGWSNYHAIELVNQPPTYVAIENCSLLLGSDVKIHSIALGYVSFSTQTGGCRIDWDGVSGLI